MDNLINANKITFQYRKQEKVTINNLDIAINEGEFVALLGANGSGKSTLLKHFNALMKPQKGKVTIANKWDTKDQEIILDIRQMIGLVFQNPENQLVSTIVEEDIAFALENLGLSREEINQRVEQALRMVGMFSYRNYSPYHLSGGQKQRVAIASILAMKPKCILFDEATSMLDPKARETILTIIQILNKEYGVTIIMTTHLLEEVTNASRVVVMDQGKILFDEHPRTVFQNIEKLEAIGLNVPLVTKLTVELQEQGLLDMCLEAVLTEEEFVESIRKQVEA